MAVVETGFRISEEIVTSVRDDVVSKPLKAFREEERPHMLPGMAAFELEVFGDACQVGSPETTGIPLRVGLLVAHRTLRLAHENRPLPQEIDEVLGGWAGKLLVPSLLEPDRVMRNCNEVKQAYEGSPGVRLLLDDILQKRASRAGASLLLGLHIPMVNPSQSRPYVVFKQTPEASHRPARPKRGFYGGQGRSR